MAHEQVSDTASLNQRDWPEDEVPLADHSLYRKIDRVVAPLPIGRVLELGCSRGRYLEHLRGRGWDVAGLELNPQAANYIQAHDLSQPFPFPGEQFDVVIAAEVIEHLVDTERFLLECKRVLRPGGTMIVTTPNLLFGVNRIRMLFGRQPLLAYADYHVRMFVPSDFISKIESCFQVERFLGSHVLVGIPRSPRTGRLWARIGDRLPRLSAHMIVVARRQT